MNQNTYSLLSYHKSQLTAGTVHSIAILWNMECFVTFFVTFKDEDLVLWQVMLHCGVSGCRQFCSIHWTLEYVGTKFLAIVMKQSHHSTE